MGTELMEMERLNNAAKAAGLNLDDWIDEKARECLGEGFKFRIGSCGNPAFFGNGGDLSMGEVSVIA